MNNTCLSTGSLLSSKYVESNNTLLFDLSRDGECFCMNLSVEDAKATRKILDNFIKQAELETVTIRGPRAEIAKVKNNGKLRVIEEDW